MKLQHIFDFDTGMRVAELLSCLLNYLKITEG